MVEFNATNITFERISKIECRQGGNLPQANPV